MLEMATVKEHYDLVLSDVYSWMLGGFDSGIERNAAFFKKHEISPVGSGIAVDLGAGCGFQSIPLAKIGFSTIAIDIDGKLLNELKNNSGTLAVKIVQDDLINFDKYLHNEAELIVCMTDTILHLESKDNVLSLFNKVVSSLGPGGKFIITFRDLSSELSELDRFIPVKSDENLIFTCFLEYEAATVKVHDLIYKKNIDKWILKKSFYRKLRLSKDWVYGQLSKIGFNHVESTVDHGFVTVIATK
jgi:2-polyprenyl-3-methyl-5-hydroxy-6-metoxy-1,4-benzoquinol methylase